MVMLWTSPRGASESTQQFASNAGKYYHASPSTTSVNNFAHLDAAHDEIEPQISDT
jgi:hypothetical protein